MLCGCVWYDCCYVRKKALLQCLDNYWEESYWPVWAAIVLSFLDGDYVSQFSYVWYYVGVKSSFQHAEMNGIPRGAMCFRCLMFSLSGPCELLCLLFFIASWTWVVVSDVISLYFMCFSVNGTVCLVCLWIACDPSVLLSVLTNCKSFRMQHWELPQDAHNTQTYNIWMTIHLYKTSSASYRRNWDSRFTKPNQMHTKH